MKVTLTGTGSSGSWSIRGDQLGNSIGADSHPMVDDISVFKQYDVAVIVKRIRDTNLTALQRSGTPYVWDVVDAWPQPAGLRLDKRQAFTWLEKEVERIRPHGFIAATDCMRKDLERFGKPILWLPHHHRPGVPRQQINERVRVVAYEGSVQHLGRWSSIVRKWCSRHKIEYRENKGLNGADIALALRDVYDYPSTHWKSNVKQANIHAAGLPGIYSTEFGYTELSNGSETWVSTSELDEFLFYQAADSLLGYEKRKSLASCIDQCITLEMQASKLKGWLCNTKF